LNFGRTSASYSIGEHTLGPLQCSGSFQSSANGIPGSCADLWRAGESISGLYQVKTTDGAIVTVFCDMTKLPEENGHQTLIGTSDIKSTLIYFTVVRQSSYSTYGIIPYERILLNMGNAMNIATGTFTAPRNGIYYFVFTACIAPGTSHGWGDMSSSTGHIVRIESSSSYACSVGSAHMTVELKTGDTVHTTLNYGQFFANGGHQISFTGYLIHEI